ncbi:MAG: hypothetical protein ABIO65_11920 [Nitrospiria bacterium]
MLATSPNSKSLPHEFEVSGGSWPLQPIVIATAMRLDAILVSLNGDFSDIVTYLPERYNGILAFQVHNHPETIPRVMSGVTAYPSSHPDMPHYKDKLLLAEPHRIRIRT